MPGTTLRASSGGADGADLHPRGRHANPDRRAVRLVVRRRDVAGEYLMFDCGPAATHKLVKAGLWPTQIDYLFFTHHHFDHDVDYPCFLLCRWDQAAGQAQGASGVRAAADHRVHPPHPGRGGRRVRPRLDRPGQRPDQPAVYVNRGGVLPRMPPTVGTHDVGPGLVHDGGAWKVTAAPAIHVQPWLDSLAYRLDSPDGSIVFTGDTQPCQTRDRPGAGRRRACSACAGTTRRS